MTTLAKNQTGVHPSAPTDPEARNEIAGLIDEAHIAFRAGRVTSALALLEAHEAEFRESGLREYTVQYDLLLGKIWRERGDYPTALEHFERALQCAQSHDLYFEEAEALNSGASIYSARGDVPLALRYLERAGTLFAFLGLDRKQADVLNNVGLLYYGLSEYRSALVSLREAYDLLIHCAPGSRSAAVNFQNLGRTYFALGEFERAEEFHREALELAPSLGDPLIEVVSRINLAEAYLQSQRLDEAMEEFGRAWRLSERHTFRTYEIDSIEGLGSVYFSQGRYEEARAEHRRALEIASSIEDSQRVLSGLLNLTRDLLKHGEIDRAVARGREALQHAEKEERSSELKEAHRLLAEAFKAIGDFESVVRHLEAAHAIERKIFNEESDENTRRLMVKFDVEKARFEAEEYRLQSEVARRAREEAEELVAARTRDLEDAQVEIVTRLAVAAEYRDDDTGEHTRRVGRTAAVLAYVLARPIDDVRLIYNAARLHDVGKIGISDTILHKPAKLTDEEFAKVKTHPTIGAKILADGHSPLLHMAERIAIGHHERWDGRGYPNRVAGEAIPLEARIVAVADVLDALLHERPYKEAWPLDEAIAEIERNGGSQFDPQVVEAALAAFGPSGPFSPKDVSSGWEDLRRELARVEHLRERFAARAERDPRMG